MIHAVLLTAETHYRNTNSTQTQTLTLNIQTQSTKQRTYTERKC